MIALRTERLLLRPWRDEDREPFSRMSADPAVMAHFPATLTRAESDAAIDRWQAAFERDGLGFLAAQEKGGAFVGVVGLGCTEMDVPFSPFVEVGWRLAREHQGKGYAFEAAAAWLAHGFEVRGLEEILSITVPGNVRSWGLMERLGMRPDGEFDHPRLEPDSPLRRHVLYRLGVEDWRAMRERTRGVRVRRAVPGVDDEAFRTVRLAALAQDPGAFESDFAREEARPPEAWTQRLSEESVFLLDSSLGARGVAIGAPDREDTSWRWLLSLWVEPGLRGTGAGQSLVAAVRDDARASGARGLGLHVAEDNAGARALYARFGFEDHGAVELPGGRTELELRLSFEG